MTWVSLELYERLIREAIDAEMSLSEHARIVLSRGRGAGTRSATAYPKSEIRGVIRELSAIGNNLNQVAKWMNTTAQMPNRRTIEAMQAAHRAAIERVIKL